VFKPLPTDDPVRRRPDINLAKKKLDWAPEVELETGLRATIEYFDEFLRSGKGKDLVLTDSRPGHKRARVNGKKRTGSDMSKPASRAN